MPIKLILYAYNTIIVFNELGLYLPKLKSITVKLNDFSSVNDNFLLLLL